MSLSFLDRRPHGSPNPRLYGLSVHMLLVILSRGRLLISVALCPVRFLNLLDLEKKMIDFNIISYYEVFVPCCGVEDASFLVDEGHAVAILDFPDLQLPIVPLLGLLSLLLGVKHAMNLLPVFRHTRLPDSGSGSDPKKKPSNFEDQSLALPNTEAYAYPRDQAREMSTPRLIHEPDQEQP
mmetsp:Transcript_601/g.1240  ORF Transcript_601/g.1240 Transcript_601/m.1240 type:complete len:181 (+) Transcript_601:2660-3202(+)